MITKPSGIRAASVRRVVRQDMDVLLDLCAAHARYERSDCDPRDNAPALEAAIFGDAAPLLVWVASLDDVVVGYASASSEFSTWKAATYLHMDCLFVRADCRGEGLGAALLQAIANHARETGCHEIQWQTPEWNADAARFYRRNGAREQAKRRFTLELNKTED